MCYMLPQRDPQAAMLLVDEGGKMAEAYRRDRPKGYGCKNRAGSTPWAYAHRGLDSARLEAALGLIRKMDAAGR